MRQGGNRDTSKLLMERSVPGRAGSVLPESDVPPQPLPDAALLRDDLPLPEISEPEVVQYFTGLSQRNFSIDTHFYPLGSCPMKYNPKINDETAFLPGFRGHPPAPARRAVAGRAGSPVPFAGISGRDHRAACGQPGHAGRGPRRTGGNADGPLLPPSPGRDRADKGRHPRQRPRHQPGIGGHGRLPSGRACLRQRGQRRPGGHCTMWPTTVWPG